VPLQVYNFEVARPTDLERSVVSETIRGIRLALGETQQQFATRLGVSGVTIAKYETNHVPKVPMLIRLAKLATEQGLHHFSHVLEIQGRSEKQITPSDSLERLRETIKFFTSTNPHIESLRLIAAFVLFCSTEKDEKKWAKIEDLLEPYLKPVDSILHHGPGSSGYEVSKSQATKKLPDSPQLTKIVNRERTRRGA
jgi:transcriptional regulator with XRE-family HTH domain